MDLVLREVIILAFVYLVTRVVGKRELSSLEPFDVILLVVVGDLVQQGITQSDTSVTGTIVVLSTLALLVVALSFINLRAPASRRLLDGEPVLLVVDGRAIDANLRRERITTETSSQRPDSRASPRCPRCDAGSSRTAGRSASSRPSPVAGADRGSSPTDDERHRSYTCLLLTPPRGSRPWPRWPPGARRYRAASTSPRCRGDPQRPGAPLPRRSEPRRPAEPGGRAIFATRAGVAGSWTAPSRTRPGPSTSRMR